MSEFLSKEQLEVRIAQDRRLSLILRSTDLKEDLRDNVTIQTILAAVEADARLAMEELTDTSPEDKVRMADLLVRVRSHVYIRRALNVVIQRGETAQQADSAEYQQQEDE